MDKINEFEWKVQTKGFNKINQEVIDSFIKQTTIFTKEYNETLEPNGNFSVAGICGQMSIAHIDICINNLKCPNIIRININSAGQITGKLEKDSPQAREFFQFLYDKFIKYKPTTTE